MKTKGSRVLKFAICAAALTCILVSATMLLKPSVHAAVGEEILKKTLLNGLQTCYSSDTYMKYKVLGSDFRAQGANAIATSTSAVLLPTGSGAEKVSCRQLFDGITPWYSATPTVKGLRQLTGKPMPSSIEQMGYSPESNTTSTASANEKCLWLEFSKVENGVEKKGLVSNKVCFLVVDGVIDTLDPNTTTVDASQNEKLSFRFDNAAGTLTLDYPYAYSPITVTAMDGTRWSDIITNLEKYKGQITGALGADGMTSLGYQNPVIKTEEKSGEVFDYFKRDANGDLKALRYFAGGTTTGFGSDNVKFSDKDKYNLYVEYFNDAREKHPQSLYRVADSDCTTEPPSGYAIYNGSKWCEVKGVETVNETYNGINSNWNGLTSMPFSRIMESFKNMNYEKVTEQGGTIGDFNNGVIDNGNGGDNSGDTPAPGDNDGATIDKCYSAAASLGWIMCPVIQGASTVVSGIYDFMIQPFMEIKSSLLGSNGGNTSTYDGWKKFRDFANVLFAIAFAVVIFAQVTDFGISNYNVKKILPRLIMVAVLVNISFILCQVAVDVSNILGSSLQKTFSDMVASVPQPSGNPYTLGGIVSTTAATLFTAAGVGGAVLGMAVTWEIWLVPFLLALFGCLLGVVFFFIILGIRQAGVILMVVLAPVAIVCYALPNTKSLFDRWRKLFTSLLLVYPICGLLLGVGQFASALLVAAGSGTEGFFFMLVAMLLSVVPFFFIPSILKSSMAAMGNLGLRVSQFGQNLSHRMNAGLRNSEMGRDVQRRLDMHNAARTYDQLNKKEAKILARGGRGLSKGAQRTRSRAAMRYNRAAYEDIRAGGGARLLREGSPEYQAAIEGQQRSQFNSDIEGRESLFSGGRMKSIIQGQTDQVVNGDDDGALQAELDTYLDKIVKNDGSPADIENYTRNAQAIANVLSSRGTGSARARVVESLSKAMHSNQGIFMDSSNRERLTRDFGSIGSRLTAKYGKDYKKDFPGATAMFGDIAKGDFSRADSFRTFEDTDADGHKREYLRSSYYSGQGITGLSAEDFSRLKTSGLRNMLQGVQDGDITGAQLESLGSLATNVLDSSTLTPDADAVPYMQKIRSAAFANRTQSGSVNGRSAGSLAIGSSGAKGIDSIFQQLQSAPEWSSMSADQKQTYQNLVSNITESYHSDRFFQEDAIRLHDALKIAHAKGILGEDGQVVAVPKAPAGFDVRQESAQQQAQQSSPLIVTPGQLTDAERQAVRDQAARINQHARRNGQQGGGAINRV